MTGLLITFNKLTNKRPELNSLAKGLLGQQEYCTPNFGNYYRRKKLIIKYDVDIRKVQELLSLKDKSLVYFTYDNNEVKLLEKNLA